MSDEQVRVWVGAFGKHPGWDDHIADQGLETELLSRVKRLLYLEGIGGNIDSGVWDGLGEGERLPGFDHALLWRWPGGLVAGRLWSSSDGKGRTRYPMIVCAHCRGLSGSWVAGHCLDALDGLAARCRVATDAAGVISAIDDTRRALRADSASAPLAVKGPLDGPPAVVELAGENALGRQGIERVAYQVERDFGSYLLTDEDSGTRSRTLDVRPRHMRVPACREEPGAACELWLRYLLERADPSIPLVAVFRRNEKFCDLIAGEPTRSQFSCLQSSLARMPMTTEIPYTIDEEFAVRVAARVEAGRTGSLRDADLGRVEEQSPRIRRAPVKPDRSVLKLAGLVAAAVALLVVLIIAALRIAGGEGGAGADEAKVIEPPRAVEDGSGVIGPDVEARRAAFLDWCREYSGWFGSLASARGEDRTALEADAHLAARVLGPIDDARGAGVVLNPLDAVSNPPPTVAGLAESPPAEVSGEEVWAKTQAALAVIHEVAEGLGSWPVRVRAGAAAERLESAKITAPAAQVRDAVRALGPGAGGSVVEAARELAQLADDDISKIVDGVEAVETASGLMKNSGDRVLIEEAKSFDEFLGRVRSSDDLASLSAYADEVGELAQLSGLLSSFISAGLDDVDPVVFAARSQAHRGGFRGVDRLRLWLSEAKQPEMQKLDPGLDPRRSADVAALLGGVDRAIAGIGGNARTEMAGEFGAISDRRAAVGASAEALAAMPWNSQTRAGVEQATRSMTREIASLDSDLQDLRAAISQDVAEKLAELKARDSFSGAGLASVDEIWRSGRDALVARYETDGNDLALFRDARALSGALRAVDAAAGVGPGGVAIRPTWNSGPIAARQALARNAAVRAHAAGFSSGLVVADRVQGVVDSIRADVARGDAELTAFLGILAEIDAHIEGLYGLDEPWDGGGTIRGRVAEIGEQLGEARAIAPALFEKVATLERVAAAGDDRTALLSMIEDPSLSDAGVLAAWLGLGAAEPAWPGGADELGKGIEFSRRARTASHGIGEGERRDALEKVINETLRARWAEAVGHSRSWDDLRACLRMREECGGRNDDLDPASLFNIGVLTLGDSMNPEADDATNRGRIADALAGPGIGSVTDGEAQAWLARVREIASEDSEAVVPLDPSAVGPALAGWRVAEGSDEERLVYELGERKPAVLAFRLVTLPTGETSYLCETELTVGVVAQVARSDPAFAVALADSLGWFEPSRDTRRGMLTWEWSGTRDEPTLVSASAWIARLLAPPEEYLVETEGSEFPTRDHPMQRLALSNALFIAARLGCRLPTGAEWSAARAQVEGVGADGGWNLRDASLARQAAHVAAKGSSWGQPMPPDSDAQEHLRGDPSFAFDDGHVWLMLESEGPEVPFRHLIGNVLEFVILDPKGQGEAIGPRTVTPDRESPQRWYGVARAVEAGVIGGSLFSKSDAPIDAAVAVVDVRGGWSDVGVRLAFSPVSGRVRRSVAARILSLVEEAPLLKGR